VTGASGTARRRPRGCARPGLVLQQRRAGHDVADLLRRAAHVDVDDLGAVVDVVARRLGHHRRVGAGDLHADRLDLALVVGTSARLRRTVKQRVRGHHLGHRHARAQSLAQLAERPIGDARHGRDDQVVAEGVRADAHDELLGKGADSTLIAIGVKAYPPSLSGRGFRICAKWVHG
jgi:hypothetical protein